MSARDETGWRVTRRQRLIDNRWLRVDVEDVILPDGRALDGYYVVTEPHWAIVFAVTEAGQVLLVRQYKHGIKRVTLELPAGYLEPGDASAAEAIRRELREETGYEAATIRHLASMVTSPTRSSQMGHVFLAAGCRWAGAQALDPAEHIDVVLATVAQVRALVGSGAIEVESSIAAIFLGLEALAGQAGDVADDRAAMD
jgi:8-oxo-dGTP pyrophosphatase MutT (NUDIX family)